MLFSTLILPHQTPSKLFKRHRLILSSCPTMWCFLQNFLEIFRRRHFKICKLSYHMSTSLLSCLCSWSFSSTSCFRVLLYLYIVQYRSYYWHNRRCEYLISMSVTDDRKTLHLPIQDEYFPFPSIWMNVMLYLKKWIMILMHKKITMLFVCIFQLLGSFILVSLRSLSLTKQEVLIRWTLLNNISSFLSSRISS